MLNFEIANPFLPANDTQRKKKRVPFSRPTVVPPKGKALVELMENLKISDGTDCRVTGSFEDMDLSQKLLRGIYSTGLEKPAHIQSRAIVPMINGHDVIMQAQSGMGKTAALVIASLARIEYDKNCCQVLLLTPTRELAEQVANVYREIGKPLGVRVAMCVGGTDTRRCKAKLARGNHVIVGTIGRVAHMMGCNRLNTEYFSARYVKIFAIDEADKMLDNSFQFDLTNILERVNWKAQVVLMSATMPQHILNKTLRFMRKPIKFLLRNDELTLDGIRQYYLNVEREEEKINVLSDIWKWDGMKSAHGMIFCRTRKRVDNLAKRMEGRGHVVASTNGELTQFERDKVLRDFRTGNGASKMLITSDLLARGIDVQKVNLVINYDIPEMKRTEEYIHRVGRGGRYGRHGVAITFVTEKELEQIHEIEKFYATSIEPLPSLDKLKI